LFQKFGYSPVLAPTQMHVAATAAAAARSAPLAHVQQRAQNAKDHR